jgi:gluconate kinase
MSNENKKDKELKRLSREILTKQVEESQRAINYAQQSIVAFQQQLQQQQGVLGYAQHLLAQFDIPAEPKEDPKKTELEVK